ncbi:alpha/beta hydrolase [Mycobacterium sp. NPDC006124]|uniref:alpha/beta hydrolase family protein n=1 Tax=Mycobacterium sp. NPDC006124 TaxID=3156729 RepID=UPI0033A05D8E
MMPQGDETFARETSRLAGFVTEAGADLGEVLATAARIPDGDDDAWTAQWRATAVRTARRGEDSLRVGDVVGAREAFLRASTYFRAAGTFGGADPGDLESSSLARCARDYFARAGGMLDAWFEPVQIPYEDGVLPGYLFLVDVGGPPRPTIVYTNGFGSSSEEGYFVVGAAALRRGYNFLAYDGPGQGAMLGTGSTMRPDWENVLGPVVDHLTTIPEVDSARVVHFGQGLGSYLVARHAVHDDRAAAIVCHDGITTFYAAQPHIPEHVLDLVEDGRDDEAIAVLEIVTKGDAHTRWGFRTGRRTFGVQTSVDCIRATAAYTLTTNEIRAIDTPVLILENGDDAAFAGQAANFARAMTAPVHHVVTAAAAGALHEIVFDYLATEVSPPPCGGGDIVFGSTR